MWKKRGKKLAQKRKKIGIAAAAVIVAAAGSTLIYHNLPQTKVEKQLTLAAKYMTEMNYLEAQEAYTEALSIDEGSVRAYRGLADDYAAQGQLDEAAEILHQGYETTQSEILLQNYCATVLNSVVEHVNEKTAGLDDIRSCLTVLESDPDNESVRSVLENCVQQVTVQEDTASLMLDELDGTSDFDEYADVAEKLLGLAEKDNSYQEAAYRFIIPKAQKIYLSLSHRDSWKELVERAQALGDAEADGILACLSKQQEISDYFAPMYCPFINRTMEYWTGNTYVPVTKEAIVFLLTDDGWKFSFVEDDSLAQPSGTIRVLGQKMEDLGVQRSSIEYVPAYDPAAYYPHTEYEIVYWNTMVSGIATDNTNVVSRMNYRFAKKTYTAEGSSAEMIYDWGGENEKRQKE